MKTIDVQLAFCGRCHTVKVFKNPVAAGEIRNCQACDAVEAFYPISIGVSNGIIGPGHGYSTAAVHTVVP